MVCLMHVALCHRYPCWKGDGFCWGNLCLATLLCVGHPGCEPLLLRGLLLFPHGFISSPSHFYQQLMMCSTALLCGRTVQRLGRGCGIWMCWVPGLWIWKSPSSSWFFPCTCIVCQTITGFIESWNSLGCKEPSLV